MLAQVLGLFFVFFCTALKGCDVEICCVFLSSRAASHWLIDDNIKSSNRPAGVVVILQRARYNVSRHFEQLPIETLLLT